MKIVALTTATPRCSIAVTEGQRVLAQRGYEDEKRHAERIFGLLDEVLAEAGLPRAAIGGLACDIGPGSFTGVRVGVASAKGVAFALGVPLVGVGSLEAMASAAFAAAAPDVQHVACILDAKRGELFCAVYRRDLSLAYGPEHLLRGEVASSLLVDEGAYPALAFCGLPASEEVPAGLLIREEEAQLPAASWIGRLAASRIATAPSLSELEPSYLRAPDAKLPAAR